LRDSVFLKGAVLFVRANLAQEISNRGRCDRYTNV